jgi:hypothetical protein
MGKPATWLLNHQASIHSQSGEDGIIGKILETLPDRDRWCVEFGALDGKSLSNTRNLIENAGYSAILIEGSRPRFEELESNYSHVEKVTALNRFVGFDANDNLDHILADTPIPAEFDFLSIDIDGNDYHVWESSSRFTPKVVCIEFNQTIPNEIKFIQPADAGISQGSSLSALVELGKTKGYELICVAGVNAFFVRSQYFPLFEIDNNSVTNLRVDLSAVTYLFIGYDGTIFLRGQKTMPWHCKLPLNESSMQRLPKFLRKFPESYNLAELLAFGVYLLFSSPRILISEIRKRYGVKKP